MRATEENPVDTRHIFQRSIRWNYSKCVYGPPKCPKIVILVKNVLVCDLHATLNVFYDMGMTAT